MNALSVKSGAQKLRILISACLALATVLGGFYLLHVSMVAASCSSDTRRFSSPREADYATVEDAVCDNLGGSDVVTVSVHTNSSDSPIFVYSPSSFSGPIDVRWLNQNIIEISIERVQLIQKQLHDVNGLTIRYHIGAIGERVERSRPKQPAGGV